MQSQHLACHITMIMSLYGSEYQLRVSDNEISITDNNLISNCHFFKDLRNEASFSRQVQRQVQEPDSGIHIS